MTFRTVLRFICTAIMVFAVLSWALPADAGERHRKDRDDRERKEKKRDRRFREMLKLLKKHRPELYEKLMEIKEDKPDLFRREVIEAFEKLMVELEGRERERHGDRERGEREERERDDRPRHDDRERPRHDDDRERPRHDDRERPRHDEDPDMPSLDEIERKAKDILHEIKEIAPDMYEKLMHIKKKKPNKFLRVLRDMWMDLKHREREGREREEMEEDEITLDDIAKMAEDILRNREELADIKRHSPDFFHMLMQFKKHGPKPEILERLRDVFMENEEEEGEEDGEGEIHELMENLEDVLNEIRERAPEAYRKLMKLREHEPEEFPRVLLDIWRDLRGEDKEREHEEERPVGPEEEEKILDFLKKNSPGWFEELMQVRRKNPDAYRHALMRARNEAMELKELIEEDPQRAEDIILNNRLTHKQWKLVEKYKRAESKEARGKIREDLRGVLNKLFDVRLRKWKRHIEELAREIEEMKKEEEEFRKEKKSIIEEKLKELLGKPRRRFPGE